MDTKDYFPVSCATTNEICATYKDYIRSEHWQITRRAFFTSDRWKQFDCSCAKCRCKDKQIDLHHLTYDRIGREEVTDLMPLCQKCHAEEHEILKTGHWYPSMSIKELKKMKEKSVFKLIPSAVYTKPSPIIEPQRCQNRRKVATKTKHIPEYDKFTADYVPDNLTW